MRHGRHEHRAPRELPVRLPAALRRQVLKDLRTEEIGQLSPDEWIALDSRRCGQREEVRR